MNNSVPLLEVRNLGYRLADGGNWLLRKINFSLDAGEAINVIGPNGAGKTTLLKCLIHIYQASEGQILIQGRDISELKRKELAQFIAWVPQNEEDSPPFLVEEYVLMGRYSRLRPFHRPGPEDIQAVEEALETCGLQSFRKRQLSTLSGGERQKAHIAAALAQAAPILLLDEPGSFLDPKQSLEMDKLFTSLNKRADKPAIITVTHDLNRALVHATSSRLTIQNTPLNSNSISISQPNPKPKLNPTRILGIANGECQFLEDCDEVLKEDKLEKLFDRQHRPFLRAMHPETGQLCLLPDVHEFS